MAPWTPWCLRRFVCWGGSYPLKMVIPNPVGQIAVEVREVRK
jgi:hypothetical protein